MDLRDMWRAVGHGWAWILLGLVLGGAAAWGYLQVTPPQYAASAQVVLLANGPVTISEAQQGVSLSAQLADTVATIIDSPAVLNDVATDSLTTSELTTMVHAAAIPLTSTIEIVVTAGDAQAAADVANETVASASDVVPAMLGDDNAQGDRPVTLQLIRPATTPDAPFAPDLKGVLVIGVGLGLCGGLALALLHESVRMRHRAQAISAGTHPDDHKHPGRRAATPKVSRRQHRREAKAARRAQRTDDAAVPEADTSDDNPDIQPAPSASDAEQNESEKSHP